MPDLQTERLLKEREAMLEIIQVLGTATDLHSTLNTAVKKIMEMIEPAETGMIFLWDDSSELLRPSAAIGYDFEVFNNIGLKADESMMGQVFSEQRSRLYNSSIEIGKQLQTMRAANQKTWRQALGVEYLPKSVLAIPISSRNQRYGVLSLEILEGTVDFSDQDLDFLRVASDLISLSAEYTRAGERGYTNNSDQRGGQFTTEWMETLSHELGMPLTAIKGYATALLLDEVEWSLEKRQEFLQLIEDECDQMEMLLRDLLNSTLIDKDMIIIQPHPLDIPQIARMIAEEMGRRTEKHQLIVDFPPETPLLQADPRWIKQVFRNLIDNAIKYSPDGGLIVIHGELRSSAAVIHVSDQGIGIPPEDLILIFDKYVRVSSQHGERVPGAGLGLPIARAIIEAHGGRIWADSTVDQGTTLSFSLPLDGSAKRASGERNESWTHPHRR